MDTATYQPTDRRPIKARGWWVFERIAHRLAVAGLSANAISMAGMFSGIAAGLSFAFIPQIQAWERIAWLAAAAFIQLRLIANLLDGMVAIESGKASPVGELYNEVPDRISDAATIVGAGVACDHIALGFAAACVAVFTAYIRATGKAAGTPQQYCGPMAKPHRMALLTAISLYFGLTPAAWHATRLTDHDHSLLTIGLWIIVGGGLITAFRRLSRIARHLKGVTP